MEADSPRDLWPAGCSPSRAEGFPVHLNLKTEAQWPLFKYNQAESMPLLPYATFLLSSGPPRAWRGPPTLGRGAHFTQPTNSDAPPARNALTDTPEVVFQQISGCPVVQSS